MKTFNICLVLFGILIAVVSAQDKSFLTWNTAGARWPTVATFLDRIDVLAIQEAGTLRNTRSTPVPFDLTVDTVPTYFVSFDNNGGAIETQTTINCVTAYNFTYRGYPYHMYYYDRVVDVGRRKNVHRDTRKQNMAIISRERAKEVYVFPPFSCDEYRVDINRPILGIKLDGYKVFTVHTDPTRSNEINDSIFQVTRYMYEECSDTKWIIMGDFNLEPASIEVPPDTHCFQRSVFPVEPTKPATQRIIDYGVYGGPNHWKGHLAAETQVTVQGSDHLPVIFRPSRPRRG